MAAFIFHKKSLFREIIGPEIAKYLSLIEICTFLYAREQIFQCNFIVTSTW